MTRFVRYRNQPIKFKTINGNLVAEVVPVSMATRFDDLSDAHTRAWLQWGDNGMEHVVFDGSADSKPEQFTLEPDR
jgi:hypothetical protein